MVSCFFTIEYITIADGDVSVCCNLMSCSYMLHSNIAGKMPSSLYCIVHADTTWSDREAQTG